MANEAVMSMEPHEGGIAARTPFGLRRADRISYRGGRLELTARRAARHVAEGHAGQRRDDRARPAVGYRCFPLLSFGVRASIWCRGTDGFWWAPQLRRRASILVSRVRGASGFTRVRSLLMPTLRDWTLADHWAGLRPKSADGLPLLGPTHMPGLFLASGQYRNGILFAPAIAELMCDVMLGRRETIPAFDPRRFA